MRLRRGETTVRLRRGETTVRLRRGEALGFGFMRVRHKNGKKNEKIFFYISQIFIANLNSASSKTTKAAEL